MATNLNDTCEVGTAVHQNGDFLTYDGLPGNKFQLIIPKLPGVTFFLQSFELPAVSVNRVNIPTPVLDYNDIGEKLMFDPFTITFMVDKYCRNWGSVFSWMKRMTVNGSNVGETDNATLLIDGVETIRFADIWPTRLSGFEFDVTNPELTYVIANLEMNYDWFDFIGPSATIDSSYK